jgi:hypothetical protein
LYSSPCNRYEKAGRGREKKHHSDPVNLSKLGEERSVLLVEFEEDSDQGGSKTEEREVDPEYPSPGNIL